MRLVNRVYWCLGKRTSSNASVKQYDIYVELSNFSSATNLSPKKMVSSNSSDIELGPLRLNTILPFDELGIAGTISRVYHVAVVAVN